MSQPITFLVWAENTPGTLIRLASLFSRRKINIDSLAVSETEDSKISRFTVVITVEPVLAAVVGRQIERMIEARRVIVSADEWVVHREIAIIRANLKPEGEAAFLNRYEGLRIIGKNESSVLMEIHGTNDRINELVEELRQVGVSEIVRSGRIAVTRDGNYEHDLTRSLHELPLGASEGPGL